jgi:hypothetical protein
MMLLYNLCLSIFSHNQYALAIVPIKKAFCLKG